MMIDKETADAIVAIAKKQISTSQTFKQARMTEILDTEDVLNFKLRPALQGRLNVPFDGVILSGFVDTLVSEVNRPPNIKFKDPNGSNLKAADKITAAFERDKKKMRLRLKDRQAKRMAAIAGRAILKYYAESDPKYCPYLEIVDYLDFECEPNGGGHLDDHYFKWQRNIFRSKDQLISGGTGGWYASAQVAFLLKSFDAPDFKRTDDQFKNKQSRYITLGLDMESNNYVGGTLFNLTEGVTWYKGKQYHVIFESNTNIWLRCVLLEEDFGINLSPFISFASPQEDSFNFWNRGPADKMKPVAESIRVNLNEILNNNRKRNWDMKAVDGNMFPDIKKLDWRQDGIVQANVPLNQSIQQGIYRFETPEISGAINLNQYLNNLAGEKLGVTPGTQGNASEQKVGIYQGNQFQISKRMKLISDSYQEMYEDLGLRYDWGLFDHAKPGDMVDALGVNGVGWDKITKQDMDPEYVVVVEADEDEEIKNDQVMRVQVESMVSTENNKVLFALVNPRAHLEEKYRLAGFNKEKIKKMLDTKSDTTDEVISDARKAMELIVEGKNPGMYWGATTDFLQYISDWILENSSDITPEVKAKAQKFFDDHTPIAMKNAEQKQFRDEHTLKIKQAEALATDPKTAPGVTIGGPAAAPVAPPVAPVPPEPAPAI